MIEGAWLMIRRFFVLTAFTLLAAAGLASEASDYAKFIDRWREVAQQLEVTAFTVAIVEGDRVVFTHAYGTRSPEDATPVTSATPFYIASSTKPFTAMGIMILADEGKLSIDDPVAKHLAKFKLRDADLTKKITVRDLMTHRYGINSSPIVWADAYTGQITDEMFFRLLETAAIGGKYAYSNVHFTILGRVIEAKSGMPWQDFLDERIFKPAGMKHTTARASRLYGEFQGALPSEYTSAGRIASPNPKADNVMHAAGGMGASADDLARWLLLNMNGGAIAGAQILSETSMKEMLARQLDIPKSERPNGPTGMGLGWMLGEYNGEKTVHHHGGYIGASARILFFLEKKRGIAVLNNDSGPASMLPEIVMLDFCDAVTGKQRPDELPDLYERAKAWRERRKAEPEFNPSDNHAMNLSKPMDAYAGIYESPVHGTLTIAIEGKQLRAECGNLKLKLKNADLDQFQAYVLGDIETLRFQFDDAGKVKTVILGPKVGTVRRYQRK
jgi:CubicO group peptidase (beta-lactamase class C family)